jgi:hypothetical protein
MVTANGARVFAFMCLCLLLSVSASRAQEITRNLEQLRLKVGRGEAIYITDRAGRESGASVLEITDSTLVVSMAGQRREIVEADIRRIRQRHPDPLWNGALIGFAVGGGLGAGLTRLSSPPCQGAECAPRSSCSARWVLPSASDSMRLVRGRPGDLHAGRRFGGAAGRPAADSVVEVASVCRGRAVLTATLAMAQPGEGAP